MVRLAIVLGVLGSVVLIASALLLPAHAGAGAAGIHEVPSLTVWGKVFAFLLLAALGVAYLVWRRPVVQARAILETSPLGGSQQPGELIDSLLMLKMLAAFEAASVAGIVIALAAGRPLSWLDTLGLLGSAAIIAFIVHLLVLGQRGRGES